MAEQRTEQTTVEQFVQQHAGAESAALASVFAALATSTAEIARQIRLAGLSDIYGAFGAVNVQGEQQQKLDVLANDVLIAALRAVPSVAAIVSEEDDEPIVFTHAEAQYAVIFDPLDGSSNIDVNVNVGTIFSVVRVAPQTVVADVLKPGTQQVAAGYVVYGPSTVMVLALPAAGQGVAVFTLDDAGRFVLTSEGLTMPAQGPYYSTNEANAATWPAPYQQYVQTLVREGLNGKSYGARYIGSLVADFHRTLLKGGVFLYPPTVKAPAGKLRLLYEARPLALVAAQAGGAATNGPTPILELAATGIHERTPLVVGSRAEVDALQRMVAEA